MKVLVTGGNGFIGSRVVSRLHARAHAVRCLLRPTSRTERLVGVAFETELGDVRDPASLARAARGCDAVVHLACLSSWTDLRRHEHLLEAIAVDGTRNVLEAARAAGVRRTVHVSSVAAVNASDRPVVFDEATPFGLGDSSLRYSIAKHRAETITAQYVREGLDVVVVLPAEVYGAGDDGLVTAGNLVSILESWPAVACSGGTSVVHVDDVADGIVAALEKGTSGERYILGGENLSIKALIELTLELAGERRRVFTLPNGLLRPLCRTLAFLRLPAPVPLDVLEYATRYWFVSSEKARRDLGFSPRDARATLRPVIDWLRETERVSVRP